MAVEAGFGIGGWGGGEEEGEKGGEVHGWCVFEGGGGGWRGEVTRMGEKGEVGRGIMRLRAGTGLAWALGV